MDFPRLTGVYSDIEEFGHEVSVVPRPLGQEQGGPVRMGQVTDIDQNFVAKSVDVQLRTDVPNELHEQLLLR